ncbi:MAG: hypothetical protein O6837_14655 [Deltaproteobacteria bacterium]|nr:hypothetical protein [Deltaproteobacteria bacterium]
MPRPAWVEELKGLPSNPNVTEAIEVHEAETIQAVKIASTVLNDDIWLIRSVRREDGQTQNRGVPYVSQPEGEEPYIALVYDTKGRQARWRNQ